MKTATSTTKTTTTIIDLSEEEISAIITAHFSERMGDKQVFFDCSHGGHLRGCSVHIVDQTHEEIR